jgi:hypothetical protein
VEQEPQIESQKKIAAPPVMVMVGAVRLPSIINDTIFVQGFWKKAVVPKISPACQPATF